MLRLALVSTLLLPVSSFAQTRAAPADWKPSPAYQLLDFALEATAREVERVGPRPTVNSRELHLLTAAMYDAWAPFDSRAISSYGELPRQKVVTDEAKRKAMLTALALVMYELYPAQKKWIDEQLRRQRFEPKIRDGSPEAVGAAAAKQLLEARRRDGANQAGDEAGGDGSAYGDFTYYVSVNTDSKVNDVDRWQPNGAFVTPHWYRVKPFALTRPAQFRPPPPAKSTTDKLKEELEEVVHYNATLSSEQKALVEFTRDGPRATGPSGQWLRFAQAVSRRDKHGIDLDVKMFFAVAAASFDAFIATWEAKRFYDSARPASLIRTLRAGKKVRGWLGPGKGVGEVAAENWSPYSPKPSPPFPGYVSEHSSVAAAASRVLELFTGSDAYDEEETRRAELTDNADGGTSEVVLRLPTFSKTAELVGLSRVMGGFNLQSDNVEGQKLGRKVADVTWLRAAALFGGKDTVK